MQHDDKTQLKRQRLQNQWERADQNERDAFLKTMLGRADGRKYLMWLLDISNALGLQDQLFTGHALSTVHAVGMHEVGKRIFAHLLEVAPDEFLMMLKENALERTNRDKSFADANAVTEPYSGPDAYSESEPYADSRTEEG